MTELQAAVALAQLEKLDDICARRTAAGDLLTNLIEGTPGIETVRPYPGPTPQQQNPYPMAYQQAPRPAAQPTQRPIQPAQPSQAAQYRQPQQQTYQAPRSQAPRQPQTYSPNAAAKTSGLSCLSKLAILVIVLAIAVALGVTVGKQLAKHRPTGFSTNRTSGSSVATSVYEPLAQ